MHLLPIALWIIDLVLVGLLVWAIRRDARSNPNNCMFCGGKLTTEELAYYGRQCERCVAVNYRHDMGDLA